MENTSPASVRSRLCGLAAGLGVAVAALVIPVGTASAETPTATAAGVAASTQPDGATIAGGDWPWSPPPIVVVRVP